MYQQSPQLVEVPIARLRETPEQKLAHADFDPAGADAWLVDDIRRHGLFHPIAILPDGTIKDGHRRVQAARCAGLQKVPCFVLISGDSLAMFRSAQMSRPKTVWGECTFNRELIESTISKGIARSRGNVRAGEVAPESTERVEQQWISIEKFTGFHRETLQRGVKVLCKIDQLVATKRPECAELANRIITQFRNQGLAPAMRLAGLVANKPIDEDAGSDPAAWDAQENKRQASARGRAAGRLSGAKRRERKGSPNPSLQLDPTDSPQPATGDVVAQQVATTVAAPPPAVSLTPTYAPDQWQTDCYKALGTLETHLRRQGYHSAEVANSLSILEIAVKLASRPRAAG